MALKILTSARTAIEATKGTAVTPATRLLYATDMEWDQQVDTIIPQELRNSYFQNFRAYPGMESNTFTFKGDATFDDLAFWGLMAVKGGVAGSGGSADKTWAFVPTGTADDLKSFTLEAAWGDLLATVGWRWPGVQVDEFGLTWEKNKTVEYAVKATTFKAATQITAFSGSLTDRTTISALGTNTTVYLDTSTIGTTADSGVQSVDFTLKNGLVRQEGLDGTSTGQGLFRPNPREAKLKLVRYMNSKTELDAFLAKTVRKVRVKTVGPALGGSTYQIQLDFYGVITGHKWAEADGYITQELSLDSIYDSTATTDFSLTVVNSLASLT